MTPIAIFFLKFGILLAGVYVIILLTPKMAAFIDRLKKPGEAAPEAPRPERVQDDINSENSGSSEMLSESVVNDAEINENKDIGEK